MPLARLAQYQHCLLRRNQDPDKGPVWMVPDDIDDEYLEQMEGERRVRRNGRWLWERIGSRPNHYWDLENFQVVAAFMLKLLGREAPEVDTPGNG